MKSAIRGGRVKGRDEPRSPNQERVDSPVAERTILPQLTDAGGEQAVIGSPLAAGSPEKTVR